MQTKRICRHKAQDYRLIVTDVKRQVVLEFRYTKAGPYLVSTNVQQPLLKELLTRYEAWVTDLEEAADKLALLEEKARKSRQVETLLLKLPTPK